MRDGVFLDLEVGHREADLVRLLQDLVGHVAHVALERVVGVAFDLEEVGDLGDQARVVLRVHLGDHPLGVLRWTWLGGVRRCLRRAHQGFESLDHVGVAAFRALAVLRAEEFLELHRRNLSQGIRGVLLGDQLLLEDVAGGLCLCEGVARLLDRDLLGRTLLGQLADIQLDELVARLDQGAFGDQVEDGRVAFDQRLDHGLLDGHQVAAFLDVDGQVFAADRVGIDVRDRL